MDGQLRYFSTAKTPRRDQHGRPDGIIGISRDITERKRAEAALAALANENRALFSRARAEELWLETILEHSHTCYDAARGARHPWGHGCGHCPACTLRWRGYEAWRAHQ